MQYGVPERIPAFDDPELEPIDMWAATIEPRMASYMMRVLGDAAPLTGLQHLKRIRKVGGSGNLLQILLCRRAGDVTRAAEGSAAEQSAGPSLEGLGLTSQPGTPMEAQRSPVAVADARNGGSEEAAAPAAAQTSAPDGGADAAFDTASAVAALPQAVADVVRDRKLAPVPVQVPKHAPATKAQWNQWCALWPLTWRPPEQSRPEDGVPVTSAGRDAMVAGMNAAFAAAADARARGQHGNGCVIVDPVTGEVVASGSDNSVAHPLKHAVMVAVDAMGRRDLRLWPDWYQGHRHRLRDGDDASASEELPCKRRRLSEDVSSSRGASPAADASSGQPAADGTPAASAPQRQPQAQPRAHGHAPDARARHTSAAIGGTQNSEAHAVTASSAAKPQRLQQNGNPPTAAGAGVLQHQNGTATASAATSAAAASVSAAARESAPTADCACRQALRANCANGAACEKPPVAGHTSGGGGGGGGGVRNGNSNSAGSSGRRGGGSNGSEVPLAQQKPYLCTGFDCYVVREPCAMCAMVLVHSRLRRVVFCYPDPAMGAVASRYRLHGQRSLNHKYQVYRLPLAADAGGGGDGEGHAGGAGGGAGDNMES